ncbi:hypothetical protein ABKN59_001969 [Abortiporus biennis]
MGPKLCCLGMKLLVLASTTSNPSFGLRGWTFVAHNLLPINLDALFPHPRIQEEHKFRHHRPYNTLMYTTTTRIYTHSFVKNMIVRTTKHLE